MVYSTLSSKGQVTIPKSLRDQLDLSAGDKLEFELDDETLKISKVEPFDEAFHRATEGTLSEWMSPEDEEAYSDL